MNEKNGYSISLISYKKLGNSRLPTAVSTGMISYKKLGNHFPISYREIGKEMCNMSHISSGTVPFKQQNTNSKNHI